MPRAGLAPAAITQAAAALADELGLERLSMGVLADPNRGEAAVVTAYLDPRNRGSLGEPTSVRNELWFPVDAAAVSGGRGASARAYSTHQRAPGTVVLRRLAVAAARRGPGGRVRHPAGSRATDSN